jgi:predicted ribosomally synthesized peptide with nif11-like leader
MKLEKRHSSSYVSCCFKVMKESLSTFRKAVNESADLQEKIKGGTDIVELGKENGHDFSAEDVTAAYEELQKDDDGELTEFEMDAVAGGGMNWVQRAFQIQRTGRS